MAGIGIKIKMANVVHKVNTRWNIIPAELRDWWIGAIDTSIHKEELWTYLICRNNFRERKIWSCHKCVYSDWWWVYSPPAIMHPCMTSCLQRLQMSSPITHVYDHKLPSMDGAEAPSMNPQLMCVLPLLKLKSSMIRNSTDKFAHDMSIYP